MSIFDIFIVSATVFFTAALSMIVLLAIYLLLTKIVELAKKRKRRAEQNQGYFYTQNNLPLIIN